MKGEKGFSLIEVMVAVGLMGVLGYVILQQTDMSSKQQNKASFNHQINMQTNAILKELSKGENCTASFQNLKFGTSASPTIVANIRKGITNYSATPPTVTAAENLFETRKANEVGVYIDSMHLITRASDNRDILRVTFASGDIDSARNVRKKKSGGVPSISKDFVLLTEKRANQTIERCYSEQSNILSTSCKTLPDGVWNPVTQKCEITGIVKKTDLLPLWTTPSGSISTVKTPPYKVGNVECRCSNKRCSRDSNCWCSLPACGSNASHTNIHRFDRRQSVVNKECILGADCTFQSQQAGWMIRP